MARGRWGWSPHIKGSRKLVEHGVMPSCPNNNVKGCEDWLIYNLDGVLERCYQCGLPVCCECVESTANGARHWRCPPREQWKPVKRGV